MKPFVCECCNYETTTKGNYKKHLETNKHKINTTYLTKALLI